MNTIEMLKFGRTLTDREYGKRIAETILNGYTFPAVLDFKGVISLGSSCGDEIISSISSQQKRIIEVINANDPVKNCLDRVAEDLKVKIRHL